jgi:hypothetical protein
MAPDGRVLTGSIGVDRPEEAIARIPAGGAEPVWSNPYIPGVLAAPDGGILVLRLAAGDGVATIYDLVDRRPGVAGRLTLARHQHIAGLGRASLYVVSTDDDGIQRVGRYPWP